MHFDWEVLLIGGASGSGKSVAAREIARQTGATLCEVDDLRMALQSITTPADQPDLHFFIRSPGVAREGIWDSPAETLCSGLIGVGRVVSRAVEVVIDHHVACKKPVVIEGDGILPALAAQASFPNGKVRATFLTAPEEFFFRRIPSERGRLSDVLRSQANMNWLYTKWLTVEAERYNLPIISGQPWEDLPARILRSAK